MKKMDELIYSQKELNFGKKFDSVRQRVFSDSELTKILSL